MRPGDRPKPRKELGQHFLTNPSLLEKIVAAADIQPAQVVLEIGPGLGHLTWALAQAGARVVAIEIDRDLAARLTAETRSNPSVTVIQGDFLTASPADWLAQVQLSGAPYKVVANIPYYVTSPILRALLETGHQPELIVIMVQLEVAKQITATPDEMNLLAVSVQFFGDPRLVGRVPAGAFHPRPKVDSAIVRIRVHHPSRWPAVEADRFFSLVRAGFGERRKQLRNALSHGLNTSAEEADRRLARAGIDSHRRAETLSLEEWKRIYQVFDTV